TSPNTAVTYAAGSSQTVTWNVAGTNAAPINTANVNILLSTDGGFTYPITLDANTPNDGSDLVTLPNLPSTQARVEIQPADGNIYFDVSDSNFTINHAQQTITFNPIGSQDYGNPDFDLTATASSGLPVSYTSVGQCTLSGPNNSHVHLTGAGSCSITAHQAGDSGWDAAPDVTRTFTIAPASTTTTAHASPSPAQYSDPITLSATVTTGGGQANGTAEYFVNNVS